MSDPHPSYGTMAMLIAYFVLGVVAAGVGVVAFFGMTAAAGVVDWITTAVGRVRGE